MNVEETESAGGQGEAMDKRAKGERDEDIMAETVITFSEKNSFIFGSQKRFPFSQYFPHPPPCRKVEELACLVVEFGESRK